MFIIVSMEDFLAYLADRMLGIKFSRDIANFDVYLQWDEYLPKGDLEGNEIDSFFLNGSSFLGAELL